tara:strand:+ start:217 stop:1014 length:798 start_codon:yes stop_codon:yes gene_type:complete
MGILQNENAIPVASAGGFYSHQIEQSCRFDNASTSYLYRTQGTGSSQRTWTFSTWFKKTGKFITSADQNPVFFSGSQSGGTNHGGLLFDSAKAGDMRPFNYTNSFDFDLRTTAVFRDTNSWGHVVMRVDTTQSTSGDRVRLYVNGTQITAFDTESQPSQNFDTAFGINSTVMYIGDSNGSTSYDGYLAETIFADGQSYAPTQFGETKNGVWIPKNPSGTSFGNNGYYLKYASGAIGTDSSGNGNTFSTNGLTDTNIVLDSPTFGS